MARNKVLVLSALLVVFLTGLTAYALQFNVQVSDRMESATFEMDASDQTDGVQNVNITVENIGSIGCNYRLRGDFTYDNNTQTSRFSKAQGLWPGETALLELYFLPTNYTGEVESSIYLDYCGQDKLLDEFNYTVTESNSPNESFEATTRSSNSNEAEVEIDTEEAILIPQENPAGWKVGQAEVTDGEASLNYEPTLFSRDTNLSYTVIKDGKPVGITEISLVPERGILDSIRSNILETLLVISVLFNIVLIFKRERLKQKLNL